MITDGNRTEDNQKKMEKKGRRKKKQAVTASRGGRMLGFR